MSKNKYKMKDQMSAIMSVARRPRITLDEKTLPAVRDWEVGGKYDIMLTVKQVGKHEMEGSMLDGTFEVIKASSKKCTCKDEDKD